VEESSLRTVRLALLALTIACALAVDLFGILPKAVEGPRNGDFSTFYVAGRINRRLVYDFAAVTRAQEPIVGRLESARPYLNPPTYLPLLELLAKAPIGVGLFLWATLTTALFLAACLSVAAPRVVLLAAISPVVWSTAAGGQVAMLVGACIIGAIASLERRPLLAGALFAVAALIKPPAVTLVPLALVACRQWKALAACLLTGVAAGLASISVYGLDIWLHWLAALHAFTDFLRFSDVIEKGVSPATLARLAGMGAPAALAFQIACAILGVAVVWRVFRGSSAPLHRLAALTTGCLLVTPYAMTQELAPMLAAAATLLLAPRAHPLFWFASFLVLASLAAPIGVILMGLGLLLVPDGNSVNGKA